MTGVQTCALPISFLAGTYLFFGEAQAVTGYAQISLILWSNHENTEFTRFLGLTPGTSAIEALFDRDYSMHLYFGDPLLILPLFIFSTRRTSRRTGDSGS